MRTRINVRKICTCAQANDSVSIPVLCKVFFTGPVKAKINAYAIRACLPRFEKSCGKSRNTIHLKYDKEYIDILCENERISEFII